MSSNGISSQLFPKANHLKLEKTMTKFSNSFQLLLQYYFVLKTNDPIDLIL